MAVTEPIRNKEHLQALAQYFLERSQYRNYLMVVMGVYTVLRINDLLQIRWSDVYNERHQKFREEITVYERKTKKYKTIALNGQLLEALRLCYQYRRGAFIFSSNRQEDKPISRTQAWRIIRSAADELGLSDKIACHSLRKTWGYHACINNEIPPAVIMEIYNHSDFAVTKRYLGITQDNLNRAYRELELF